MQSIAIGLVFVLAGGIFLWGGYPEHKLPDGQPSQWALRSRVGLWLFVLIGAYVAISGALRVLGLSR